MPTRQELIATDRDTDEICHEIGADNLVFRTSMRLSLLFLEHRPKQEILRPLVLMVFISLAM